MTTVERDLWIAVIARAIVDLHSTAESVAAVRAREDAARFFERRGADFNQVCSLAGLDADAVQEAYRAGRFETSAHDLQGLFRSPWGQKTSNLRKGRSA